MEIPILLLCVVIIAICTAIYHISYDNVVRAVCTIGSGLTGAILGTVLVSLFI